MRRRREKETHETERREGDSIDKQERRKLMRQRGVKETRETSVVREYYETDRSEGGS
jgi:hypothetical protein